MTKGYVPRPVPAYGVKSPRLRFAAAFGLAVVAFLLAAMGLPPEITSGAVRVSLGWNTTSEDIERFGVVWRRILSRQQSKAAA